MKFNEAIKEIISDHSLVIYPEIPNSDLIMYFKIQRNYTPSFISDQYESLPNYIINALGEKIIPEILYLEIKRNGNVIAPGIIDIKENEIVANWKIKSDE